MEAIAGFLGLALILVFFGLCAIGGVKLGKIWKNVVQREQVRNEAAFQTAVRKEMNRND